MKFRVKPYEINSRKWNLDVSIKDRSELTTAALKYSEAVGRGVRGDVKGNHGCCHEIKRKSGLKQFFIWNGEQEYIFRKNVQKFLILRLTGPQTVHISSAI